MITKVINVNLHQPIYERLTAKQGDIASRYLLFHLLDGDKPFDLTGKSVRVYARKPDKTDIFNDLIINDETKGYCTLELTSQCLAEAGIVKMELVVTELDKKLTSIPFDLEVLPSINSENAIISTNEFTALINALASLSEYDNYKNEIKQKATKEELKTINARIDEIVKNDDGTVNDLELQDIRIKANGDVSESAGKAVREQFIDMDYTKIEFAKNKFNLFNILKNVYINQTNGSMVGYEGWDSYNFWVAGDQVTKHNLFIYENGKWIEPNNCFVGMFRKDGSFVGGYANIKLSEADIRGSVYKVVVSLPSASFKKHAMIFKDGDFSLNILSDYRSQYHINDGEKVTSLNAKNNIIITSPYVFHSWNQYCYFKFEKILLTNRNRNYEILWSDFSSQFSNLIANSMTSRVRGCCELKEGKLLVMDTCNCKLDIVDSLNQDQLLLLKFDLNTSTLFGELFNSYNNELCDKTGNLVQEYIPSSVINSIDTKTQEMTKVIDEDKFTFAYLGDNHTTGHVIGKESNLTNLAINRVDSQIDLDAIINAGDSVLSYGNPLNALTDGNLKINKNKLVYCEGNHDRYINPAITKKQYYNAILRHYRDNENVHLIKDKAYFYRDFKKHKIRVVVLTLYDMPDEKEAQFPYNDYFGYNQEQMEWLCNIALKINSDWQVMVVVHSAPVTSAEGMEANGTGGQNPLVLRQILESFKNGTNETITHASSIADGFFNVNITTDFQSQGARDIICVLSGHNHLDRNVKINEINYISICSGYIDSNMYSGTYGNREGLTYSAVAFDVVIINKNTKTISFNRYGFGTDRVINY